MNKNNQLQIRNSTTDFLIFNSVCRKFRHTADDSKNYQIKLETNNKS